ncbi:MAG: hypothetical protein GY832_36260 [Chloroflexi bacterium]|nr:hypothetical protein [Chloroflexota bacterium]
MDAKDIVIAMDSFIARGFPHDLIRAEVEEKRTATEYRFYNDEDTHIGTVLVMGDGLVSITSCEAGRGIEGDIADNIIWLPTFPTAGTCGLWTYLETHLLTRLPVQDKEIGVGDRAAGRPSNPDDDWAYQEVKSGRDQIEVYKEWLQRIPESRKEDLADPLDSFKKAMRYRKKKEKRE